jgi:sugar/nucleoside kinase (ribokinase family)
VSPAPAAAAAPPTRLVQVGSILVDITMQVNEMPALGGDALAHDTRVAVGGGFNALLAARRQGLAAAYAGRVGTGPFGQMVSAALRREAIDMLGPVTTDGDSGFCVVIVDGSAEHRMLSSAGVEGQLTERELEALTFDDDDLLYVSGYDLAYPHGSVVAAWLANAELPGGLIFDPGPLAVQIDSGLIDPVLRRARWLSLNAQESLDLTGESDHRRAAQALLKCGPDLAGVVLRDGAAGCLLAPRDGGIEAVPGFAVEAVDTTGAGDCHVGAFAAALARRCLPGQACRYANAAAAIAVSRWGAATGPTLAETERLLA